MPGLSTSLKRVLVGRPFSTDRLSRERLPKRLALPTFAADALSSVAYAPDEILLTLAVAGVATYALSPWIALAVVAVMAVVVLTHRNIIEEYPTGGGDFEVAQRNLGVRAGRIVGSALLVDYVLTVAVSTSQAAAYAATTLDLLHGYEVPIAVAVIALLALINLRGVRESNRVLAVPVYLFMAALGLLLMAGAVESVLGTLGEAPSADFDLIPETPFDQGLTALGGAFLVLRAFTSGCAALTGVEAVANGVPSFRPPKAQNASFTLLLVGAAAAAMTLGIIWLAGVTGVQYVQNPQTDLAVNGEPVGAAYRQIPVIGQIAEAVFGGGSLLFGFVIAATVLVLGMAANTAFNGFPNLASILAKAGHMPRQFAVRGDRLAYSNGIIALGIAAALLVWVTGASVTLLIQMYIVGVFVSFAFGQLGMVRHYTARLRISTSVAERRSIRARRLINRIGFTVLTAVLAVVIITKFADGAWAALLIMAVLYAVMSLISSHYARISSQLELPRDATQPDARPGASGEEHQSMRRAEASRAIVLVAELDKPTVRALDVAAANRHLELQALTVKNNEARTRQLIDDWRGLGLPMPLRIVYSPYREFAGPIVSYVLSLTRQHPDDVVVVYIPEFLVGHWWEALLHNHSVRRVKRQLTMLDRVVVATVPWQLGSARERSLQLAEYVTGSARRRRRS